MFWATTHGIAVVVPVRGFHTAKRPNVIVEVESTSHRPSADQVIPAMALVVEVPATVPAVAIPGTVVTSVALGERQSLVPGPPRTSAYDSATAVPVRGEAPCGPWAGLRVPGTTVLGHGLAEVGHAQHAGFAAGGVHEPGEMVPLEDGVRVALGPEVAHHPQRLRRPARAVGPRTVSAGRPMGCRTTSPWLCLTDQQVRVREPLGRDRSHPVAYRVRVWPDAPRDTTSRASSAARDGVRACRAAVPWSHRWLIWSPATSRSRSEGSTRSTRAVAVVRDVDHPRPRDIHGKDAVDRSDAQHRSGHRPRAQVDAEQRGDGPGEHADPGRARSGRSGDARPVARVPGERRRGQVLGAGRRRWLVGLRDRCRILVRRLPQGVQRTRDEPHAEQQNRADLRSQRGVARPSGSRVDSSWSSTSPI